MFRFLKPQHHNMFVGALEAKEFLVSRIVEYAQRTGVALDETEQKMLYFSETDATLPDIEAVTETFERDYDQVEYEAKLGKLAHATSDWLRKHQPEQYAQWKDAADLLRREDHYLSVIIDLLG